MGNKRAKDDHKRLKIKQENMKISADAAKEMAAANRDRVSTLQNNSLMKFLTLPTDNMSPELASFVSHWKLEEAIKLKQRMQSPFSFPTPHHQSRAPGPLFPPPPTGPCEITVEEPSDSPPWQPAIPPSFQQMSVPTTARQPSNTSEDRANS